MADDLPAVLELLHTSEHRWRTLRAEGEEWIDAERSGQAYRRNMRPGALMSFRGVPGPADRDPSWKVWLSPPRSRVDFGGPHQSRTVVIGDGHRTCASHPHVVGYRVTDHRDDHEQSLGPAGALVHPVLLAAALELTVQGRGEALGREVIVVRGRARPATRRGMPWITMGADELDVAVDVERGVLLWSEARFEGAPFRRITMTAVGFDEDLDDHLFAFPEGAGELPFPPERPRRPPADRRAGDGPPDGVLGEPVGGPQIVARADSVVVAVDRVVAYPTGFELGVTVRTRGGQGQRSFDEVRRREWRGASAFPGESLQVSVVFADGRRSIARNFGRPPEAASSGVRLVPLSGSGTDTRFDQRFWVEPLPPPGPLGVVVEWDRRQIPETRAELDAGAIVAGAARAATLWP